MSGFLDPTLYSPHASSSRNSKGKIKPPVDPEYIYDGPHAMPDDYYDYLNIYNRQRGRQRRTEIYYYDEEGQYNPRSPYVDYNQYTRYSYGNRRHLLARRPRKGENFAHELTSGVSRLATYVASSIKNGFSSVASAISGTTTKTRKRDKIRAFSSPSSSSSSNKKSLSDYDMFSDRDVETDESQISDIDLYTSTYNELYRKRSNGWYDLGVDPPRNPRKTSGITFRKPSTGAPVSYSLNFVAKTAGETANHISQNRANGKDDSQMGNGSSGGSSSIPSGSQRSNSAGGSGSTSNPDSSDNGSDDDRPSSKASWFDFGKRMKRDKNDYFSALPDELHCIVSEYLTAREQMTVSHACPRKYSIYSTRSFQHVAVLPENFSNYYAWATQIRVITPEMFFTDRSYGFFRHEDVKTITIHEKVLPDLEATMRYIIDRDPNGHMPTWKVAEAGHRRADGTVGVFVDGKEICSVVGHRRFPQAAEESCTFSAAALNSSLVAVKTDCHQVYLFDRNRYFRYRPDLAIYIDPCALSIGVRRTLTEKLNSRSIFGHFPESNKSEEETPPNSSSPDDILREPEILCLQHIFTKIATSMAVAPRCLYQMYMISTTCTVDNITSLTIPLDVFKQWQLRRDRLYNVEIDFNQVKDATTWNEVIPTKISHSSRVARSDITEEVYGWGRNLSVLRIIGHDSKRSDYEYVFRQCVSKLPSLRYLETTHAIHCYDNSLSVLQTFKMPHLIRNKALAHFQPDKFLFQETTEVRRGFRSLDLDNVTDMEVFLGEDKRFDFVVENTTGLESIVANFLASLNTPALKTLIHQGLPFGKTSSSIFSAFFGEAVSRLYGGIGQTYALHWLTKCEFMMRERPDYIRLIALVKRFSNVKLLFVTYQAAGAHIPSHEYQNTVVQVCQHLAHLQTDRGIKDTILADLTEREEIFSMQGPFDRLTLTAITSGHITVKRAVGRGSHLRGYSGMNNYMPTYEKWQDMVEAMTEICGDEDVARAISTIAMRPLGELIEHLDRSEVYGSTESDKRIALADFCCMEALLMELGSLKKLEYLAISTPASAVGSPRLYRLVKRHPGLKQIMVEEPTRALWKDFSLKILNKPLKENSDSRHEYVRKHRILENFGITQKYCSNIWFYTRPLYVQGIMEKVVYGYAPDMFVIDVGGMRKGYTHLTEQGVARSNYALGRTMFMPEIDVKFSHEFANDSFEGWI